MGPIVIMQNISLYPIVYIINNYIPLLFYNQYFKNEKEERGRKTERQHLDAFHDCKSPQYFFEKKSKNTIAGLELIFEVLMCIA